jgi:hypothetical protein
MLSIQNPELLLHLIGVHTGKAQSIYGKPEVIPRVINQSTGPRSGTLHLVLPNEEIIDLSYNRDLLRDFHRNRGNIRDNYFKSIVINDQEDLLTIIENSKSLLEHISASKKMLKEFINENLSIEDFFR